MYDGTTENIYIRNDGNASFAEAVTANNINCNETLDVFNSFRMMDSSTANATINKIGQSSFAGKMQIKNELVVQGHSSFVGGIKVLSSSTSSFGGPVIVNSTSSFTGVANFENDISVTGQSFAMYDGTTENIYIRNNGNASFAEAVTANNINCNETLDVFNSFRMVDGSTSNVTINNLGQSSFAGEMQINNTLDVDGTLDIKTDGVSRITLTPAGVNTSTVDVLGELRLYNNPNSKNIDLKGSDGTGSFGSTVTCGGFILGNATITKSATAARTYTIPNVTNTEFVMKGGDQDITGTISSLSNHNTDGLSEGSTNLYFTTGRARGAISAGTGVSISNGSISIGQAVATNSSVEFADVTATTFTGALSGNSDTATTAASCSGNSATATSVSSLSNHTTTDLSEGTSNKYFTTQRVIDALITPGNIRLGYAAGETGQQDFAVAIGLAAGKSGQGDYAVAVGRLAGETSQGDNAIAIGEYAGGSNQGDNAIAIGERAGETSQGSYAIALGYKAGQSLQPANSFYTRYASVRGLSGTRYEMFIGTTGEIQKNTSDDRLKHDEKIITGAVKSLSKLRPQEYLKRQNLDANVTPQGWTYEAGLMAQEVYYSAPELRHIVMVPPEAGDIDNYTPPPSDDPTQDPDYSMWGDEFATVDYKQLAPYLVKAVQEIVTELPRSKTTVSNTWGQSISGLVVSANENAHKTNVTPIVTLSNVNMDKKWYGVVSDKTTDTNDYDTLIDTKGDTQIWVTDRGGPLESGDLITTSNIAPGFTQKQSDDIVRNYTVAKVTQDCDFTEPVQRAIKVPKQELSNVTYYRHDASWYTTLDRYEKIPDFKKTVEEEPIYFREDVNEYTIKRYYQGDTEISREKYNTLSEDDRTVKYLNEIDAEKYNTLDAVEKATYSSGTRKLYKVIEYSQSKTQIPQHDEEVIVQELVNVLDENGQIVWEETGETEPVYTLVDHGTYKAALVSCKLI